MSPDLSSVFWHETWHIDALNRLTSRAVTEPGSVAEPSTVDSGCSSKEGESA